MKRVNVLIKSDCDGNFRVIGVFSTRERSDAALRDARAEDAHYGCDLEYYNYLTVDVEVDTVSS